MRYTLGPYTLYAGLICGGDCVHYTDENGCLNKFALIQYWFDGPPVEVKPKPHGNSHTSQPYFRVAESAKARHRAIAYSHTPKSALQIATQEQGGELQIKGLNALPRNLQQLKNYRRSEKKKDGNVLYSVMLQCKVCQGKDDAFVRDVKAAPEPQCVMFSDWQISDLDRFVTNSREYSVLTADTTYNLGDFYVTPMTYQHLMLEDITTGKHPTFVGPVLVHQRKNFSAFNYFASTLISHNKKLRNVCAFGTDGDPALIDAFTHNFPYAKQLRCFIHLKRNVTEKLKERGIPNDVADEFLADIFGKRVGNTYEEGLVDSCNESDFKVRLDRCKQLWLNRESAYLRPGQLSFYDYFLKYYADVVCYNMLKDLRTVAGLGSPPAKFTTNGSESINALVKRKVNFKETEWPEFNSEMKQIVGGQREETIRALSGRGRYRLCKPYDHLKVDPLKWVHMTPEQRKAHLKIFDSAALRIVSGTMHRSHVRQQTTCETTLSLEHIPCVHSPCNRDTDTTTEREVCTLSVAAEESGIETLSFETIHAIWVKAEQYLISEKDIVPAPGNNSKAMMVASQSSNVPHFVCSSSDGQYYCDNGCLQWKSSKICSHTVAVAEKNGDLHAFLQWYICTNQEPNITSVAMSGLPSGRGRKGGVPKRKRNTASQKTQPEVVVHRPATRPVLPATTTYLPSSSSSACSAKVSGTSAHVHKKSSGGGPSLQAFPTNVGSSGLSSGMLQASASLSGASGDGPLPEMLLASPSLSTTLFGMTGKAGDSRPFQANNPSVSQTAACQSPTIAGSGIEPLTSVTSVPSSTLNYSHLFPALFGSLPFTVTQSINSSSIDAAVSQSQSLAIHPSGTATNSNPFFIRFIAGNIRMCQGCRSSLRSIDGGIPQPPFDLAIARFERRTYRDKNGELKTPTREQAVHYHLKVACVTAASPYFVPANLVIPADVLSSLSVTHKEYLRLMFGLAVE